MSTDIQTIVEKLDSIKSELDFIKEHMVAKEDVLSSEELEAYKRSFNKDNIIPLEEVEKKLGL